VGRRVLFVVLAGLALAAGAVLPASGAGAATSSGPCGLLAYRAAAPPTYDHIVLIMEENLSFKAYTASQQVPFLKSLGPACGSELDMHNATHSSQPNYMAVSSGIASGSAHVSNDNLFHQVDVAGDTWRSYVESMSTSCSWAKPSAPLYRTGHNAAFWYTNLRGTVTSCTTSDVPSSPSLDAAIAADALPTFSWVVPNLCDDMHSASSCTIPSSERVKHGDDWLSTLVPRLTGMPGYREGHTLIVITWDEGNGSSTVGVDCTSPAYYPSHPDCQIPTLVVSPYLSPGATDRTDHNLYGLLGTIEDLLGYPRLNRAVGQSSLRPGLGF
jgi:phospholipase C